MPTFVLPLADQNAMLEAVGGKGMSLAKMARAGLPVPGGFHVTTEAYRCFIKENRMQPHILAALQGVDSTDPAALERISQQITAYFKEGTIPLEITAAIVAAYSSISGATDSAIVAVRSSATAEDLPGMSFAGQQETYLNICGAEAVLEAVKKCWASLWMARAIGYRARNNIASESVALAVVVQALVPAEAAGILFTANPLNGRQDEIVINAAWGLGEAIVGGSVTPDTITIDKNKGHVIRRETAVKQVMTVRTKTGTEEQPVPDFLKSKAVLSDHQAAELARYGCQIEDLYGMPMDIEWAIHNGGISILQARPITGLPDPQPEWKLPYPKPFLMRGSTTDLIPDALSPLFATLGVPIATKVAFPMYDEVMGLRGADAPTFEVLNGYLYLCFMTESRLWKFFVLHVATIGKMFQFGKVKAVEVQSKCAACLTIWQQMDLETLKASELLAGVYQLFEITAEHLAVLVARPIPLSNHSELEFNLFYNTLIKRKGEPPATTFLLGLESLPLRAEKSLFELAQWAKEQVELADYLEQTPVEKIWAALQSDPVPAPLSGAFAARFAEYLAAFGHIAYDLDFMNPVPADCPIPVLDALKVYLTGQGNNPCSRQRAQEVERKRAEQAVLQRIGSLRRKWFQKLLHFAQECAIERENAIANTGLPYQQIRRLLRELGERLVTGGAISQPEDIYWLEGGEVASFTSALEMNIPLSDCIANVEARKIAWKQARKLAPPPILPENSWLVKMMAPPQKNQNTLKGKGTSAGVVTARACVLRSPEDFGQMHPGDILVAVATTPAWTPLLAMASAVVADIGGPLSHASIVAREFGIPAVMATGTATRRIHTGQTITVDGSKGIVILKE